MAKRADDTNTLNRFIEGRLAESSGDPVGAAAIYRETLRKQPDNRFVAGKAYVKAVESGDFDLALRAVRILELGGTIDPEMPIILFADAFAERNWNAAKTAILELESLKNFGFLSPYLGAWIEVASGGSGQAELAKALKSPTSRYYYAEQSLLLKLARGDRIADRLVDDIVEKNEARMAPVRIIAARHYLAEKQISQALAILKNHRTGPETKLYRDIQDGAAGKLGRKMNAKAGAAFLLQRLAADLGAQRAHFLALVNAEAAAAISPRSDYGFFIAGRARSDAEQPNSAIASFNKIAGNSPYALVGLSSQAAIHSKNGDYAPSLKKLDAATMEKPESPELEILRGQILQLSGDNAGAAAAFKKAIGYATRRGFSKTTLANYWLSLGGAQEQAGAWAEGLTSLRKALELQPNSPNILNYYGYAQLERRENTKAAITAIKKAHKLRPSSAAITDSLGWAYYIIGDFRQAVSYLERALAGEPQDPTINEHLGDAYWAVGRKYEARYAWKSAKLFADNEDMTRLSDKIDFGVKQELTRAK